MPSNLCPSIQRTWPGYFHSRNESKEFASSPKYMLGDDKLHSEAEHLWHQAIYHGSRENWLVLRMLPSCWKTQNSGRGKEKGEINATGKKRPVRITEKQMWHGLVAAGNSKRKDWSWAWCSASEVMESFKIRTTVLPNILCSPREHPNRFRGALLDFFLFWLRASHPPV